MTALKKWIFHEALHFLNVCKHSRRWTQLLLNEFDYGMSFMWAFIWQCFLRFARQREHHDGGKVLYSRAESTEDVKQKSALGIGVNSPK